MKKLIIAMMLALPMICAAQEVLTPEQQLEQAQKQLKEAQEALAKAQEAKAKAMAMKQQAEAMKRQEAEVQKQKQQIEEQAARVKAEAERIKAEAEKITEQTPTNADNSGWTAPKQTPRKKTNTAAKGNKKGAYGTKDGNLLKEDPMYLEGAVPVNEEGKVEFTLDLDVPGKSAAQLYDLAYAYLDTLTQDTHQVDETSRIVLVNKEKGTIVCAMKEWLVFRDNFLSLDRSEFNYHLVVTTQDNHLNVTLGRIRYNYEPGRKTGFLLPAEEVITDKYGLNRKKTDLARIFGKFRKGTIDRKNQIFNDITAVVQ